jgi:hypothetical protein
MNKLQAFLLIALVCSCSASRGTITSEEQITTPLRDDQTFLLTSVSSDKSYGYSASNPIEVGGVDKSQGPLNERRFLNALAGPMGETVSYFRAGSCCPIKSNADPYGFGSVMLDNYRVTWEGSSDTVSIYINMYDYGKLEAPVGFTIKER